MIVLQIVLAHTVSNGILEFNYSIIELNVLLICLLEGCFHVLGLRKDRSDHQKPSIVITHLNFSQIHPFYHEYLSNLNNTNVKPLYWRGRIEILKLKSDRLALGWIAVVKFESITADGMGRVVSWMFDGQREDGMLVIIDGLRRKL